MCEHYCVNIHLWIASLNALYPACPCTKQVYLHLHLLHCHLHITMCHHMWIMCEHYCVNMHLPIASLNALYPVCPCTMQVYLHLHLLHCHLHITMCHHLWTLCEHYCVNMHLPIVSLNAIVQCMSMHKASLSTSTSTTLPLAYHHMLPSLNIVWTLMCEHASVNIFLNTLSHAYPCTKQVYLHLHLLHCHLHITMCHHLWTLCEHYCVNMHLPIVSLNAIVQCMSMHKASLSTSTSTTLPLAYHHMLPSLNIVWTLMCEHASVNIFLNTLSHACPCTKQVYLHLHVLHCHFHITMCHHLWTLCEHASTNCFLKLIATCMSRHNVNVCTCTCNILLLASEHVQHVWMCAHPCSTLWILCDHVTTCVKVWTMLSSVFVKMYYMVP